MRFYVTQIQILHAFSISINISMKYKKKNTVKIVKIQQQIVKEWQFINQ